MVSNKIIPQKSFWRGKRVLVTGHTGFKGSWLSLWLNKLGAEVYGIGLPPEQTICLFNQLNLENLINHNTIDVRDFDSLSTLVHACKPDVVLHLAAQAFVRRSYIDPLETWNINLQGSLHLLASLQNVESNCAVVMITTDKVYKNNEWDYGYREEDQLGGYDPYSASKAALELAVASWRSSFCGSKPYQNPFLKVATARAGNVVGGGDWSKDRIIPDIVRALITKTPVKVRNPYSTRPWQHVLEPLSGYLLLAESLYSNQCTPSAYNFGPMISSNKSVDELVRQALLYWPGDYLISSKRTDYHEATKLNLQIDKAYHQLSWSPVWDFAQTVQRTIQWYKSFHEGVTCLAIFL